MKSSKDYMYFLFNITCSNEQGIAGLIDDNVFVYKSYNYSDDSNQ